MSEDLLYCDGASRGNPGPAAIGAVLYDADGGTLGEVSESIGQATNNVAEYRALIAGLALADKIGRKSLRIRMDSELVVQQVIGKYRVKNEGLKPLHQEVQKLLKSFPTWKIEHVRRELNKAADALANAALDA